MLVRAPAVGSRSWDPSPGVYWGVYVCIRYIPTSDVFWQRILTSFVTHNKLAYTGIYRCLVSSIYHLYFYFCPSQRMCGCCNWRCQLVWAVNYGRCWLQSNPCKLPEKIPSGSCVFSWQYWQTLYANVIIVVFLFFPSLLHLLKKGIINV